VRVLNRAHAFLLLQVFDVTAEFFHFSPVNLWTEMMFRVIAVVEKEPVINFPVAAHAPRNRLVRIRAVMPVVAVQVTKAMAKIPKRQEVHDESPVDEVNRNDRDDNGHNKKRCSECRQLNVTPEIISIFPFPQILANRADVVAEEAQENIAPRIFGLAVVAVSVDRQPIDCVTFFILPVGVPLVMLHMHGVVHCLREAAGDRLRNSKQAIDKLRSKKRVMNEVMSHPVDIRIHHQRINESETQHHPQRSMRK